ncbi:MAG: hypothetical protein GY938_12815, partial [Ketobacter sp.]|nr:hypothetical protein [Ketobacter sp.]
GPAGLASPERRPPLPRQHGTRAAPFSSGRPGTRRVAAVFRSGRRHHKGGGACVGVNAAFVELARRPGGRGRYGEHPPVGRACRPAQDPDPADDEARGPVVRTGHRGTPAFTTGRWRPRAGCRSADPCVVGCGGGGSAGVRAFAGALRAVSGAGGASALGGALRALGEPGGGGTWGVAGRSREVDRVSWL